MTLTGTLGAVLSSHPMENDLFFLILLLLGIVKNKLAEHGSQLTDN